MTDSKRKPAKAATAKTPPAMPAQGLKSRCSETCIKIAKALREFDGEE